MKVAGVTNADHAASGCHALKVFPRAIFAYGNRRRPYIPYLTLLARTSPLTDASVVRMLSSVVHPRVRLWPEAPRMWLVHKNEWLLIFTDCQIAFRKSLRLYRFCRVVTLRRR